MTYGSALEKHLFTPEDKIDAGNGTITVANHTFYRSTHTGTMTYSEALRPLEQYLCDQNRDARRHATISSRWSEKMGFGSRTGIELPAETQASYGSPEKWNGDSLASMSIGYEIGVTALQMATCFCDDSK